MNDNINYDFLEFAQPQQRRKYHKIVKQQQQSFKAWQADSLMPQNNIDLLRNFKSQLVHYQQRYKHENYNGISLKLPSLQKLKRKLTEKSTNLTQQNNIVQPLTQRKSKQSKKKTITLHKSIQMNRQSSNTIKSQKQNITLPYKTQKKNITVCGKQQPGKGFAKVHEMRFQQNVNKRRIRKRDIYLSIFGQRGKNKIQKIAFDNQNKPIQLHMDKKTIQKNQKQQKAKQNYNVLRYKLRNRQQNGAYQDLIKSTGVMRF